MIGIVGPMLFNLLAGIGVQPREVFYGRLFFAGDNRYYFEAEFIPIEGGVSIILEVWDLRHYRSLFVVGGHILPKNHYKFNRMRVLCAACAQQLWTLFRCALVQ